MRFGFGQVTSVLRRLHQNGYIYSCTKTDLYIPAPKRICIFLHQNGYMYSRTKTDIYIYIPARLVKVLRGMVGRIIASPEVELYRRIRKSNKDVIEDLGKFQGGEECLIAIGFQLEVGTAPLVVDKTVPVDKGMFSQ